MRVLLRNRESGFYYGADNKWVPNPDRAIDWANVDHAREATGQKGFSGAEVVLAYQARGLRTPFALRHRPCPPDTGLRRAFAEGLLARACGPQKTALGAGRRNRRNEGVRRVYQQTSVSASALNRLTSSPKRSPSIR